MLEEIVTQSTIEKQNVQLVIDEVRELLIKKKELQVEIKKIDEYLNQKKTAIINTMKLNNIQKTDLSEKYEVEYIPMSKVTKILPKSKLKQKLKEYGLTEENIKELYQETERSEHIRVSTKS